jgi:RNA polymerase sigma-70 factor (ECF subfamily)
MVMMDPETLGRLVDEHAAALVLYARQWCAAPEDVVQEALLKLVTQRSPPTRPVAWLYRVVRNSAVSAARAAGRRRRHETAAAGRQAWFTGGAEAGLDVDSAAEALGALPLEQREVIVAHLWGRLTFDEIGKLVGTGSSTVHRRYAAGLESLRERLGVTCPPKPTARS